MERTTQRSEPTTETDLADAEVVHRYLQIESRGSFQQVDSENDWFILGDQETWIEPQSRRPIQTHPI